jgi:periplasmic divalent cation tolerance protein
VGQKIRTTIPSQDGRPLSSSSPTTLRIVLTTLGDTDARALARTLVEERLAACVNILSPMTSVYRWKGQVEEEVEQQLVIKTSVGALDALQARLLVLHPYETPELIVLEACGAAAYSAWLEESTRRSSG